MSGVNNKSYRTMRPEKRRKVATISKNATYDKMQKQKTDTYSATHGAYGKPLPERKKR